MVGFGVFADNRFRLFREVAGHLLAGFVAGIVDSFLVHVAVTQGGDVFEIDACREVGKQENVPCEIQIGRTVGGYLRLHQPLHLLLADGAFAGSCPQPSDFELQERTVLSGENPLGKSLVIDSFQNAEFRGYRIALVTLFH